MSTSRKGGSQETQSNVSQFFLQYNITDNQTTEIMTFQVILGFFSIDAVGLVYVFNVLLLLLLFRFIF